MVMIRHDNRKKRLMLCIVFVIYLIGLVYFTVFCESLGRSPSVRSSGGPGCNLIPFTEIRRFWVYRDRLGMGAVILNLFGNVAAFIPCGLLLPHVFKRCTNAGSTVFFGLIISLLIECTQYMMNVGSFDVDDMLLNTLGAAIGCIICLGLDAAEKKRTEERCIMIRRIEFE